MNIELLTLVLFASVFFLMFLGVPVVFALGGVTVAFSFLLWGPESLFNIPLVMFRQVSPTLIALPLFSLMAIGLERSGIADQLYGSLFKILGGLRGGLAIATVVICVIFGAISGSSGPAVICMTLVALPSMMKRKYDMHMALGTIAGGGVLGILIPPSLIMILYASVTRESVGMMFFGGLIPGLIIAGLFIAYIAIRCGLKPEMGPPIVQEERANFKEKLIALRTMALPMILILVVLGVIYTGIATPSEAAGIGALGTFIIAWVNHKLSWRMTTDSVRRVLGIAVMVIWIVGAASAFNAFYVAMGARDLIVELVASLEVSRWLILAGMMLLVFFFGMIMDDYAVVLLVVPIYVPIITALGFDTLWFAILFVVMMQTAYLTPPYGFTLFVMRMMVPEGVTMGDLYRSVWPFVTLQVIGVALVAAFPAVALWLPYQMIDKPL